MTASTLTTCRRDSGCIAAAKARRHCARVAEKAEQVFYYLEATSRSNKESDIVSDDMHGRFLIASHFSELFRANKRLLTMRQSRIIAIYQGNYE